MFANLPFERPFAILDLETTGTSTKTDRIVEISVLKLHPGAPPEHRTARINPGMPIPPEVTAIHGITDADIAAMPRFEDVADAWLAFLDGCDLCGYNLKKFDLPLLNAEFLRVGRSLALEGRALVDPLEIFLTYEPRTLAAAVRFYCGREHAHSHQAAGDVLATADVLDAMLGRYADLPRDVRGLHERFKEPGAVNSGNFFTRVNGEIRFVKGKHRGEPLDAVARRSPDYLEWMLREDFFNDTKAVARAALERIRAEAGTQAALSSASGTAASR